MPIKRQPPPSEVSWPEDSAAPRRRGRPPKVAGGPAEPLRRKRALAVGAVVAPLLEPTLAKKGVALARLIPHWGAICPLLAKVSAPESLRADTLTVAVASDAVKQELLYMTPHLVEMVNTLLGYPAIAKVRAITRDFSTPAAALAPARVTPALPASPESRDRAQTLCQHVADDALKAALVALGATCMEPERLKPGKPQLNRKPKP